MGTEKLRGHCLMCKASLPKEPVLSFSGMPASAQDIPSAEELASDSGMDLSLYVCGSCGLCQFDCEPVPYYREVIRAVGLSETMKELRRRDYRHMIEDYGLSGGKFIECGCGRGEFLKVLKEFPVRIFGIEADELSAGIAFSSLNVCETCGSLGPRSFDDREPIPQNIGICDIKNVFPEHGDEELFGAPFDCFLSFNFLEHQPDPVSMLSCMYKNLRPGGYGLITVPALEYILEKGSYYEFIRDHIANYDRGSLEKLLRICGFEILEMELIGIGDTLRAVVRKPETDSRPVENGSVQRDTQRGGIGCRDSANDWASAEKHENIFSKFENISNNQKNIGYNINKFVDKLSKEGKKLALWGAGHQGFTIASTTALSGYASFFIDSAAFKQGRFAPASHIPIVSPEHFAEHRTDVVMITAPGYIREIREAIEELCREKGIEAPEITDILSL